MTSSPLHRAGQDGDIRFRRMLGFSAFIHLLLLSFIILSTNLPAPKWTFGPVYSVQLVSLSDQMLRGTASSSLSREILQARQAPSAIILRKPVEMTTAVPIKKADVQKKQNISVEKALDVLKNKIQAPPTPLPATNNQTAQMDGQAGQAETGQRLDPYIAEIWSKIRGQWSLPQGILPKGNVETIINVKILRNGAIMEVGYEKRSGNRYFDDSAVRAVKKASPLPPLPAWIRGNSIEIGIRFHSAEFH
ncbi:MAG: energy transducer TonB [Deltaproteobacteria bacterium]|nr:energy transducer TonB [Deltaproteobacteria bacterium]